MMAEKTLPSEPQPVWGKCIPCGQRFIAGYADDVVLSMACQSCVAGLFRVIDQSPTVLVPLPSDTSAGSVADTAPAAASALPDSAAPVDVPRPLRQPRPRVRRVPLYEPLTDGLRRRFRRDS
jgi:hypothetical protein